jgi:uncharacterized protein YndB with AHSA1/START domain
MQKQIKHTWFFKQSPQEVWEYLTKPELLEQWLMKTDFQPIAGHKFSFTSPTCKIISCEVLEIKPFTKLSYSWLANSASGNKPFNSEVVWTLLPKENGTELQLVHHGFSALEDYIGHNNGWTMLGNRFVELLNSIENDPTNA